MNGRRAVRLAVWVGSWSLCLTQGSPVSPLAAHHRASLPQARASGAFVAPAIWNRRLQRLGEERQSALHICSAGGKGADVTLLRPAKLRASGIREDNTEGGRNALPDKRNGPDRWNDSGRHTRGPAVASQKLQQDPSPSASSRSFASKWGNATETISGRRQGSMGGQGSWRGGGRARQGSIGAELKHAEEHAVVGGISHAKSGQPVEVKYENDWRPAVIVGLTHRTEVVVQYVGGNEYCRETIDMRSTRLRTLEVKGSGTVFRVSDADEQPKSGVTIQLDWCAQIAVDAAKRGRSVATVPLVASQSAIGWRQRREVEAWVGTWAVPGKRIGGEGGRGGVLLAQLPRDLASFTSLVSLLDALEAALSASPGEFGAKQGVIAMNHIKRLSWQCQRDDVALKGRTKDTMRCFAMAAAKGMDHLSSKDVALLLNAVTSVLDVRAECPGLRTQSAAGEASSTPTASPGATQDGGEHSRDSCVFWGMFETASRRLLRLDTLYTAHAMAGVKDFDNPGKFTSQGVAMVANALSHAGIRDEQLLEMLSSVVLHQLSPREYTAQTVALIAAAFERLSFHHTAVFARLAQVAVEIPARSFDGQALSAILWSLSRSGNLSTNVELLRKTEAMVKAMPVRKWNVRHMCRALQAISSAHTKLLRGNEGDSPEGTPDFCAVSSSEEAAAKQALDDVARALFGYVALHLANGNMQLDANTSPTTMGALAADCVQATERGWLNVSERDGALNVISRAATLLASMCVHAFSHSDISVLLSSLSRARFLGGDFEGTRASPSEAGAAANCPVPHNGGSAAGAERGEGVSGPVWASMLEVLCVLPIQPASVVDIVSLLRSVARAGEAGAFRCCEELMKEAVVRLLQHVSRMGVGDISPAQVAAVVVSAARCKVRDEESILSLTATADLMLRSELEKLQLSPLDPAATLPETASTTDIDFDHKGGAKCPFPHHLIPGVGGKAAANNDVRTQRTVATSQAPQTSAMQKQQHQSQQHMSQEDIGALVRAVAYLNIVDRQLLSSAASVLRQRASSPDAACVDVADRNGTEFDGVEGRKLPQAVANMAWAAAVMGGVDSNVHSWLASSLGGPCGDLLSHEQLVSVHQYLVEYQFSQQGSVSTSSCISGDMLEVLQEKGLVKKCRRAMDQSVSAARKHVVSSTQQQVMEELRYLHLAPEEEYVDHSTGYSIDALVQLQGRNARTAASTAAGGPSQILKCIDNKVLLAVEVDGPSHFGLFPSSSTSPIRNDLRNVGNYQVLGGTAMKKRHLVFVGYTVMSVPYWEWDAMNSFNVFEQRATRLRYLKHQLHSHGLLCEKVDNVQKVVNS